MGVAYGWLHEHPPVQEFGRGGRFGPVRVKGRWRGDRIHRGSRGGGEHRRARRLALYARFDRRQAEDRLAHVAEAEADVAAEPAVDRQHRAGGDQCEIALALADLLERPAVPLDRNRDADLHQQLARLERGFKVALEERLARSREALRAIKVAPRRLTTSGISEAGSLWHRLPPMVPRLRTEWCETRRYASTMIGQCSATSVDRSTALWVVSAPMRSSLPSRRI